jgi:hypothetical protein
MLRWHSLICSISLDFFQLLVNNAGRVSQKNHFSANVSLGWVRTLDMLAMKQIL